jgi:MFS family permease
MSETADAAPHAASPAPPPPGERPNWKRRIILGVILLAGAVVLFLVGAAFIPRWWAQRIGDQVDGSGSRGVGFGLFYGFVFTLIPLIVLWIAFRKRRPIGTWLLLTALAAVLAAPNLFTLGIVVGNGDAAHAGERILDTEANYFRASTLIGAIVAGIVMLAVIVLLMRRHRRKKDDDPRGVAPPADLPAAAASTGATEAHPAELPPPPG